MQIIFNKKSSKKLIIIFLIVFLMCLFIFPVAAGGLDSTVNGEDEVFSPAASSDPANGVVESEESDASDLLEDIRGLNPKSFSGICTTIIFIILSILILYLKIRKGNTDYD